MKPDAAVVIVRRGPLVLALTRKQIVGPDAVLGALTDLHLPGGKVEPAVDIDEHGDVCHARAGAREVAEETGLRLDHRELRHVVDYVTRSGRPVSAFVVDSPPHAPEHFGVVDGHAVGWVEPGALVSSRSSFGPECRIALTAAGIDPGPGQQLLLCPACGTPVVALAEHEGLRVPAHAIDPLGVSLCGHSLSLLDADGEPHDDAAKVSGLVELASDALAAAQVVRCFDALRRAGPQGLTSDPTAARLDANGTTTPSGSTRSGRAS